MCPYQYPIAIYTVTDALLSMVINRNDKIHDIFGATSDNELDAGPNMFGFFKIRPNFMRRLIITNFRELVSGNYFLVQATPPKHHDIHLVARDMD